MADYQAALQAITFSNGNPHANATLRDIEVVVNDGDANSNVAHTFVTAVPVNNAPDALDNNFAAITEAAVQRRLRSRAPSLPAT